MRLPNRINIRNEANRRSTFKGIIVKDLFKRFPTDTVDSINTDAEVEFDCSFDYEKNTIATGKAKINITSTCMRCCSPFDYDIVAHFTLAPVSSEEQADKLDGSYSPLQIDEFGEVNLVEGIEEELIMHIPLTPKHDDESCFDSNEMLTFGDELKDIIEENKKANNPFAALEQLKDTFKN